MPLCLQFSIVEKAGDGCDGCDSHVHLPLFLDQDTPQFLTDFGQILDFASHNQS